MDEVYRELAKFIQADMPMAIVACGIAFLVCLFLRSPESNDLRWVPLAELPQVTTEESVLRLGRKAAALCGSKDRE